MKSSKGTSLKSAKKRSWLLILPVIAGVVVGWYIAVRIMSPVHVVQIIELEEVEDKILACDGTSNVLRVGCYNIAHGRGGKLGATNWDGGNRAMKLERVRKIGKLLQSMNLDIVVLNEVDFSSVWSGHVDQARIIAKEAGYRYIVEQRNIDVAIPFFSLRFGNAILSKYPLSDAIFLDYPHPSQLQEILVGGVKDGVAAMVALPGGSQIQVVAVHLSLEGEAYRHASVQTMLDFHRQSGVPMISMGDFNSTAKGYPGHSTGPEGENCIDALLEIKGLSPLPIKSPIGSQEFTFPSEKPDRAIDWIFVSSPWEIQGHLIIPTDLSDHLPVTATLTLSSNDD